MSQIWKTIPLFISSTFRDMHAERDQLNRVVFPAIEERLKPRRCRVAPIDLRVGVETDSTQTERERELQILKVCLAEIERSRPFLLVLLGDRYGWEPGDDRIRAASSEAGFTPEDNGGSVTALEIEYGLLKKDPVQRRRCLLCLREPLPYGRMPEDKAIVYSDAHATDPGAPHRVVRLKKLKAKINADAELSPHLKSYTLDWDAAHLQPTAESVIAWGRAVEAELWKLLDEETRSFAAQAEPTWEEQERFAIEEQVERLNGSFVGRQPLIQRALELASSATTQGAATGLIFSGASGTGKSALFARLHHQLSTFNSQSLLLSHTAGVSPKSRQTEWMLRRWIGELGAALGETLDVPEDIKPKDLETLFAQLLHRVAAKRRVVVLVDALNQFLRTERARTVSWLPVAWPANARFIATTIPGDESIQLARRPGLTLVDMPPLDSSEAGAVAAQVYGSYRRTPNTEVLRAVLALRQSDGTHAAGNPLWLRLALDLLNLLDADDFTAAEAALGGSPEEKLRRFVLDRARTLPPLMEELYGRLLAQVEKVVGIAETRAFAALIALSRHGWREEDFEKLLPTASAILSNQQPSMPCRGSVGNPQFKWDPLRFAVLRRCFRAHLVKRGALEQWDFAHSSLRRAVLARLEGEWKDGQTESLTRHLYSSGADYLETLPPGTSVLSDEIMWQMLGTRNTTRVARYYALPTSDSKPLALFLSEDQAVAGQPLRQFVLSLVQSGVADAETLAAVSDKFNFDLNNALAIDGHLSLRRSLLDASRTVLTNLTATDPTKTDWQRELSITHGKLSDVLREQGDLQGALTAIRDYHDGMQRLVAADSSNVSWRRDLEISRGMLGDMLRAQGDSNGALAAFCETLTAGQKLAAADPSDPVLQHNLGVTHIKLAEALRAKGDLAQASLAYREALKIYHRLALVHPSNVRWQHGLSVCHINLGDVLLAQGDSPSALAAYRESLNIFQQLAAADPANTRWQRDLSTNHNKFGHVLRDQGDLARALTAYRESLAIRQRLAAADPSNTHWQHDLLVVQANVAEIVAKQGDLDGAIATCRDVLNSRQRLAATDPSDAYMQRNLGVDHVRLGDMLKFQGDLVGALGAFSEALAIFKRLAAANPLNADWLHDVTVTQERLGDVLRAKGDLAGALATCRESLAIKQRLAMADPSNADLQSSLSVGLERLGDMLRAQSDFAGAQAAYAKKLVIAQKLANTDATNPAWLKSLAASFQRMAFMAARFGIQTDAAEYFAQCHSVLRGMQSQGMRLDPQLMEELTQLEQAASGNYAALIAKEAENL